MAILVLQTIKTEENEYVDYAIGLGIMLGIFDYLEKQ